MRTLKEKACVAVILAGGGVGRRLGYRYKPLMKLGRWGFGPRDLRPHEMLFYALKPFLRWPKVVEVVVVVHSHWMRKVERMLHTPTMARIIRNRASSSSFFLLHCVEGGKERWQSVYQGFRGLQSKAGWVMIHDVARPFLGDDLLKRLWEARREQAGVIPALAVQDTIKRVSSAGVVQETVSRNGLWAVQTPQLFSRSFLSAVYREVEQKPAIAQKVTDEAQLAERLRKSIRIVSGSRFNIKITDPEDVSFARLLIR